MEQRARHHAPLPAAGAPAAVATTPEVIGYGAILASAEYRRRTVILLAMWFCAYITIYAFSAGFTSVLAALHYRRRKPG